MSHPPPGDLFLARLLARPALRWMLFAVFLATAMASVYLRVVMASTIQVLPWYGVFLSLYGFTMAFVARDFRSRMVYIAFGLLIAASFSRVFLAVHTRTVGVVEVVSSLLILLGLVALGRDERFVNMAAMLKSTTNPDKPPDEKGDDDTLE